jgi:uncharacterized membrane protein
MHFLPGVLSPAVSWACIALAVGMFVVALPGLRALRGHAERVHLLLGSALALAMLWTVNGRVDPGVAVHVLGTPAVALVLGWRLTLLAGALAELALAGAGLSDGWSPPSGWLLSVAVPGAIATSLAWLVRFHLPRNPFVFIFACAFLGAGVAVAGAWLAGAGLLLASGQALPTGAEVPLMAFLPLVLFPEAFINGGLVAMLIVYRPDWVRLYDEVFYGRR